MRKLFAAAILAAFSFAANGATTSCPATYYQNVGPVVDCEIGSQRRASEGTSDATIVNADSVFGLTDWTVAFNSTYGVSEYDAVVVNDSASNLNDAVSVMLVWTPFEDATVNQPNYVAYLLPRDGQRTSYFDPFDYISGDHFGAQQYTLFKSTSAASVVPVPAAIWLFGSALGLLGWIRRKNA